MDGGTAAIQPLTCGNRPVLSVDVQQWTPRGCHSVIHAARLSGVGAKRSDQTGCEVRQPCNDSAGSAVEAVAVPALRYAAAADRLQGDTNDPGVGVGGIVSCDTETGLRSLLSP